MLIFTIKIEITLINKLKHTYCSDSYFKNHLVKIFIVYRFNKNIKQKYFKFQKTNNQLKKL